MIWAHRGDRNFGKLLAALSKQIWGVPREVAGDTILAVTKGEDIRAIVAFHNFDADNGVMEISAAGEPGRWLSRSVLKEIFGYVFKQCDCQAAVMRCDPDDKVMARISKAYGFTSHLLPHMRGTGKSEAVYVLAKQDWLRNGFHKEKSNGQKLASPYSTA